MATTLPVSDLKNYNKVLESVSWETPVYLTVNGRRKYVIRDIKDDEEYEKAKAMVTLLLILQEGKSIGEKEGYIYLEDVQNYFKNK